MNKINILVLDDVQIQREGIVAKLLPSLGYILDEERYQIVKEYFNIIEFARPSEAEAHLNKAIQGGAQMPDLIISDVRFEFDDDTTDNGRTRGIDFVKFVNEKFTEIPTIIVTLHGIENILEELQDNLPNQKIGNIYAIAREDKNVIVRRIDSEIYGLPFLLKKIAKEKLNNHTLTIKQKEQLFQDLNEDNYLNKIITTPVQSFEMQHLMCGWLSLSKDNEGVVNMNFDHESISEIMDEYLDDDSFEFRGLMNKPRALALLRTYMRHPNHKDWVEEIRVDVRRMLVPFFQDNWKYNNITYEQISHFLSNERVTALTAGININMGNSLDLNKAVVPNIENEETLNSIQNLLKARLIVLTIIHRKAHFFPHIPNVADLAIFIALFKGTYREDFLEALYFIKNGNRPRNGNERAINADTRNEATMKSYFNRFLAIRGSLTINVKNRARITQDSFNPELLLQEERDWLRYIDENEIFM